MAHFFIVDAHVGSGPGATDIEAMRFMNRFVFQAS